MVESQYAYEKLTTEAYYEKSYSKALMALTLNRMIVDVDKAREVLDALKVANKNYWIELK